MNKFLIATAICLGLAACQTTTGGSVADATAATQFFGKSLVAEDGTTFIFNEDGTVGGMNGGGEEIVGSYEATGAEICSTFTAPANLVGREFCSTPMIDGDTVVFNRRDGSSSPAYMIKG